MGGNGGGEYRFVVPVLPPSVNSLHNVIWTQRKVVLKPEILKWRSDIAVFIPRVNLQSPDTMLRVDLVFHYRHYYQNGNLRLFDTHNMIKVFLDVLAWKIGCNDCRMKYGSWS